MKIIIGQPFASGAGCFEPVLSCFLIFILAFAAGKSNILGMNTGKRLHGFATKILLPLFMFGAFQIERSSTNSLIMLNMFLIAAVSIAVFAVIGFFCYRNDRYASSKSEQFALAFSDYAAFGIPVMYAYGGRNGLFCCAAFILVSHVVETVYGKKIMTARLDIKKELASLIASPIVLASLLGMLLYFIGLSLPGFISNAICSSGSFASPLIIASLGIIASTLDLSAILDNKKIIITAVIKLILFPLLVFSVCLLLFSGSGTNGNTTNGIPYVAMTLAALPCSASAFYKSEKYKADAETAALICTLTTAASLITIPLVTFIAMLILPIK